MFDVKGMESLDALLARPLPELLLGFYTRDAEIQLPKAGGAFVRVTQLSHLAALIIKGEANRLGLPVDSMWGKKPGRPGFALFFSLFYY